MRAGLKESCGRSSASHWRTCQADYRMWLFGTGEETAEIDASTPQGKKARRGIRTELVQKVMKRQGDLAWPTLLRCRIRYFVDSKAIGGKVFLDEVFARNREALKVKREAGARKPRGLLLGEDWRTLTDLRGETIL